MRPNPRLKNCRDLSLILIAVLILALTPLAAVGCSGTSVAADTSATTAAPATPGSATTGTSTPSGSDSTDSTTAPSSPVPGGILAMAIAEPAFIDPLDLVESEGIQVGNALFDSLVAFDPKTSETVPAVAESWEMSPDARVWTFHLRHGTTFHNGREVTAADFKYAWERMCNPESESYVAYHLAAVQGFDEMQSGASQELSGVKALDDYTLQVTLAYPFADFEYVVGHPALAPVPREEVEKDPAAYAESPVGNGPFMMAEPWQHDQYIRLVRYDDYYGGPAYIDGVDFKIVRDPESSFLEFKAGNVDFTFIPSGQVSAAVEEYGESPDGLECFPGEQVLLGPEATIYFFVFNTQDPVLKDPDVRRAISLAINREAIAQTIFEGLRAPATNIVPPGILGYEDGAWQYSDFNRTEAARLLAQAGHPEGEGIPELVLFTNSGGGHEDVLALMQADLQAIGIQSRIESAETAQFLEMLGTGQFQIARYSWSADYPIIDSFVYPLFDTEAGDNVGLYSNPAVDQAIVEARGITSLPERLKAYQEIVRAIGDDAPAIPIVAYKHQYVGSERVRGLVYSPLSLCNLEQCWLSTD
jgi:oligopeptide transport system substrate-binding protein